MNENWRDYSKYTDKQLDDLLKGLAGEPDYAAVVFEYQRRQNARWEADNKSRHAKTQRLARWAIIFAALSGIVGIVFGLIPYCSDKPPSSATHSPPITPLQQPEAQEPRQTPAIPPPEQPPTEPTTTSTPDETDQELPEEPLEDEPEESPTPSLRIH